MQSTKIVSTKMNFMAIHEIYGPRNYPLYGTFLESHYAGESCKFGVMYQITQIKERFPREGGTSLDPTLDIAKTDGCVVLLYQDLFLIHR